MYTRSKHIFLFIRILLAGYWSLLGLLLIFSISNPLVFSKLNSIEQVAEFDFTNRFDHNQNFEVEPFIRSIPYNPKHIYVAEPKQKYQKTLIEGQGDCSNLSYGLAYLFREQNSRYLIIAFLKVDGFLEGVGHVALQTKYQYKDQDIIGIIDLYEGGLPISGDIPIDLNILMTEKGADFTILPFHSKKDSISKFYTQEFLDQAVIGISTSEDVERYFRFVETFYVNLGHRKSEKYLFDGLAIVFNKYPKIYLLPDSYKRLLKPLFWQKVTAGTLLALIRLLPVAMIVSLLLFFSRFFKKKSADSSDV